MKITFDTTHSCYVSDDRVPVSHTIEAIASRLNDMRTGAAEKFGLITRLDTIFTALQVTKQEKTWGRTLGNLVKDRFIPRETVGSLEARITQILARACPERAAAPPTVRDSVIEATRKVILPVDAVLHKATAVVTKGVAAGIQVVKRERNEEYL
jgi:hypothetical protein